MIQCTEEQRAPIDAVMQGKSIFLTGPGGTGKSFILETLYKEYKATGKQIAITALTGCAAILLGPHAKTLHSWAGIGLGKAPVAELAKAIAYNKYKKKNWIHTDCLVIDEVSMMTPQLLETLDELGRRLRRRPAEVFGGIQIVFVGDFFQLPPVSKDTLQYAFQSPVWHQTVQRSFQLKTIHRQSEAEFHVILQEARAGALSPESYAKLAARKGEAWKGQIIRPTLLFTRNNDVNTINTSHLGKLKTDTVVFQAKTIAPPSCAKEDIAYKVQKLDKDAPYEAELELKIGAQVMLLINLDPAERLVNGSRGVVKSFGSDGYPLVLFKSSPHPVRIPPHTWESDEDSKCVVKREQIPLRLAYALTIHKAQGASLDSALVDIGRATFEYGQAYVALSRVRSLSALYVYDIDPAAFRVHPAVRQFYDELAARDGIEEAPLAFIDD